MKRKYIAPDSFVVIVHLNNSVLKEVGVVKGSPYSTWEAGGKRNASITESDEEATPVGTVGGDKSVWDD